MARLKSLDLDNGKISKFQLENQSARQKLSDYVRNKKIERLACEFENVPEDEREKWVSDDIDDLESRRLESEFFCDSLSSASNMAVKVTGWRWYHPDRRIGRIWKSIHENNISDNTTTMLIFRNGDPTVYRLSVGSGKETGLLSQAISSGYTLSGIKVAYSEVI